MYFLANEVARVVALATYRDEPGIMTSGFRKEKFELHMWIQYFISDERSYGGCCNFGRQGFNLSYSQT